MADGWVDVSPSRGWPWESVPPGPGLADVVSGVDVETLPADARASFLKAAERLAGWAAVVSARAVVAVADAVREQTAGLAEARGSRRQDWAGEELAAALRVAPATALGRLATAEDLVRRWPALGDAVAAGALTRSQARVVAEGVSALHGRCDGAGRDLADVAVEQVLLSAAGRYPPARLRERVAARVLALDPEAAARRRRRAQRELTDVTWWAEPEGMGAVVVRGPAPDALAVRAEVTARARAMRARSGDADSRTAGQWRVAAVMAALGLTPIGMPAVVVDSVTAGGAGEGDGQGAGNGRPDGVTAMGGAAGPQVRVTVDLLTLLGLAEVPGELEGYGPIDPELARAMAADGDWVRWVTDPVSGYLLDEGSRRFPGARLARFVASREARCSHPVCGVRSAHCDTDHVPEYRTATSTRADVLTMTCPTHNRGRDASGWTAAPDAASDPWAGPEPVWTSPLGQRYRSLPHSALPVSPVPAGWVPPSVGPGPPPARPARPGARVHPPRGPDR